MSHSFYVIGNDIKRMGTPLKSWLQMCYLIPSKVLSFSVVEYLLGCTALNV